MRKYSSVLLGKTSRLERFYGQTTLTTETIAELYAAHGPRLYRYAVLILADRHAAEDAVHDAFVQLSQAAGRRRGEPLTFAYAAVTVRNTCYSMLRRRRHTGVAPLIEPAAPGASEEERMVIDEALKALPVEQREVVYLKVFEGLTFQEVALRCGISINTAGSRYRYAMAALRRALAPGGEAC